MAREGFFGSLGLLVLLCSVNSSTQQQSQDKSADRLGSSFSSADRSGARSGYISQPDEDKSAQAAANALAQSHSVGHPMPISTTPWPYYTTTPYYPPPPPYQCIYADQIIHQRNILNECEVCVCVQRYGYLEKVCGNCNQCPPPNPPTPPPTTTPVPPSPPPPPPPPKCDPFPTNQYFPNPMDPCQLCICLQPSLLSEPAIECTHNPACVIPTTSPNPGPPPPDPWICEKYPANIFFPYPHYPCFLCRCEKWGPEPTKLQCIPNPACEPTPPPDTPTTVIVPTTKHPLDPHVDPLPGPRPHPSCRPFVPDMIFQHPWDPCLECVCSESQSGGFTNVQVNCYTKAECCIIPPGPEPTTPYYPHVRPTGLPIASSANANANAIAVTGDGSASIPGSPGSSLAQADAAAEAAAQAQAAAEAVQANYVNQYPFIQPSQMGSAQAQAAAQAQAQANQALAQALSDANAGGSRIPPGYYNPNSNAPGGYANANANANAFVNSLYQQPSPYYPGSIGGSQAQAGSNAQAGWGSAQAQADAMAQGDVQAQANAHAQSNSGFGRNPVQDAVAQAQANAQNALFASPQQAPLNPYVFGGLGSSLAQAQANAEAEAGRGSASAQAAANALAQELAAQAQSQAAAQVNAKLQPVYQSQPIYAMRSNGDAEEDKQAVAQAQAQAEASANSDKGVDAAAQAQASAAAAALKSGDSDAGTDEQY